MELRIGDKVKWYSIGGRYGDIIYDVLNIDKNRRKGHGHILYRWTDPASGDRKEIWCSIYDEVIKDLKEGKMYIVKREGEIIPMIVKRHRII